MKKILIIGSYARDVVLYQETGERVITEGGPAYWIQKALREQGHEPKLATGKEPAIIDITVSGGKETGIIRSVSGITVQGIEEFDAILVSTVADEFLLPELSGFLGVLAIDVQGYVRAAKIKGMKKFKIPESVLPNISILKANESELRNLQDGDVADQKKRILIVTMGEKGVDIYEKDNLIHLDALRVNPSDTIGAGDVFLASFVGDYLHSRNVSIAGKCAIQLVREFLSRRGSQTITQEENTDVTE